MSADAARDLGLNFAAIPAATREPARDPLRARAHLQPIRFHTHVWFDYPRQRTMFSLAQRAGFDVVALMLDAHPRARMHHLCPVIEEFAAALREPRRARP